MDKHDWRFQEGDRRGLVHLLAAAVKLVAVLELGNHKGARYGIEKHVERVLAGDRGGCSTAAGCCSDAGCCHKGA